MPRFAGNYRETFTLDAAAEDAMRHFGDLETIARNYGDLLEHEIIDEERIRFVLVPKSEKGVTFQGRYTCRYYFPQDDVLVWETTETDNMWSTGRARFIAEGGRTRVEYQQRIETEMQVNRILGKLISPIVTREINNGVRDYLERMRRTM